MVIIIRGMKTTARMSSSSATNNSASSANEDHVSPLEIAKKAQTVHACSPAEPRRQYFSPTEKAIIWLVEKRANDKCSTSATVNMHLCHLSLALSALLLPWTGNILLATLCIVPHTNGGGTNTKAHCFQ